MDKGEHFEISDFRIFTTTGKISPSTEIEQLEDKYKVKNVPDSIFGGNSLSISHPFFSLMFSGRDSVRTMKTNPQESIGLVNQHLNQVRAPNGELKLSDSEWISNNFTMDQSEKLLKIKPPVQVTLASVPFDTNEALFVPSMNVRVASSNLWKNKTGEVSEKLGIKVGEEEVTQDWTFLNAYEGLMSWKNPPKGKVFN